MTKPNVTRGRYRQLRGRIIAAWGRLTADEDARLEGDAEVVLGAAEERLGLARARALEAIDAGANALAKQLKKAL